MVTKATAKVTPARGKSNATKDGEAKCPSCKNRLPITKFPTVKSPEGDYVRSTDECRSCRDARRAAKRAKGAA